MAVTALAMGDDYNRMFDELIAAANVTMLRRTERHPLIERIMQVNERYNGDWVLPDLSAKIKQYSPSMVADAIDHSALRAASVGPNIFCPSTNVTAFEGPGSQIYADIRRKAYHYTWFQSQVDLHRRRAFRHMFAYATTTWAVVPNFEMSIPQIVVRDPLNTFPEPKAIEDLSPPRDCGFIYGKSGRWLADTYPESAPHVLGSPGTRPETVWDVLEWVDDEKVLMGIMGPRPELTITPYSTDRLRPFPLRRWENRAGRCTVVTPQMITLDKLISAVAKVIDQSDLAAKLMWLDIAASEKATFPDKYVIGSSNNPPKLVAGRWIDGREGDINVVLDATDIGAMRDTPDPNNRMTQDRLERNFAKATGDVPAMSGEAGSPSLRTGKAISDMLGASIDPRIQEVHEVDQRAMTSVNEIVCASYKGYFGSKKYTVFSGWPTDKGQVEFTPDEHFETHDNVVAYPIPGADVHGMTVAVGQLRAMEAISVHTGRVLHPWVKDPEAEERQVLLEKVDALMEAALFQRANDPMQPFGPADWAIFRRSILEGKDLGEAILAVDEVIKERQLAAAAEQEAAGGMGPMMEQMQGQMPAGMQGQMGPVPGAPGMAGPGEMPPPVAEPPTGVENLREVVRALRAPQTQVFQGTAR